MQKSIRHLTTGADIAERNGETDRAARLRDMAATVAEAAKTHTAESGWDRRNGWQAVCSCGWAYRSARGRTVARNAATIHLLGLV